MGLTLRVFVHFARLLVFVATIVQVLVAADVTISGTISDATGAVVRNATITARSRGCTCSACGNPKKCDCCVDQITRSDENGSYRVTVAAGDYTVEVRVPGFGTKTVNVPAVSGASQRLDITVGR